MATIKCSACGAEISPKAAACPKCGHPNPKANYLSGGQVLGALVIAGVGLWWYAGGGFQGQVASNMATIQADVARDAVTQYEIAKKQGDRIQICVQAGLVSAAYLQAKDEANYRRWKATEAADCKRAGVPR